MAEEPTIEDGAQRPPGRATSRRLLVLFAGAGAAIAALLIGAGVVIGHELWTRTTTPAAVSGNPGLTPGRFGFGGPFGGSPPSGNASGAPSDVAGIAAKVDPAIVDIDSNLSYQGASGAGTGIVVSSNGEVLTNNHVIEGATKLTATDVGNGKTYNVSVVGYDPESDVAVLQLQGASGLETASLGDSSKLSVGDPVVGIGNAGGGGGTPSAAGGSITALNTSLTAEDDLGGGSEQLSGMIEINAPIQSGDSGGPLVDANGKVIGIDTAGSSRSGFGYYSNTGYAYAVPIDTALSIAKQIEAGTTSATVHVGETAFLGVSVESANPGFAGGSTSSGLTVQGTVSGDPAAKAGLVAGDVITAFGGQAVDTHDALTKLLIPHHPGDKVSLTWTDASGQSHTATVTLASGPPA